MRPSALTRRPSEPIDVASAASPDSDFSWLSAGPVNILLWIGTTLLVVYVAQRIMRRPGVSPMEVVATFAAQGLRIAAFAAGTLVIVALLWLAGEQNGLVGSAARTTSSLAYLAIAITATFFLARQVLAPPWWRLNAWEPHHVVTDFGIRQALDWIREDVRDLLLSMRLLDRIVVSLCTPLAGLNLVALIGPQRALLAMYVGLLICYVALVVALLAANRIPRVLLTRLQEIRIVARNIASGNLSARASVAETGEYEELGELVADVNTMAHSLQLQKYRNDQNEAHLQQTLLHEQERSTRDPLTQMRNHRYFHESLASEIVRCSRTGELLTVAIIDLDNFKAVNDTYGHQEGDAVLLRTADALSSTVRPYDLPARLGGEEFGVIFPSTTPEEAKVVMDRIMAKLQTAGPEGTAQTFSGGIATFPVHSTRQAELCQMADSAAYAAKLNGKAHIVIFDPANVDNLGEDDRINTRERDEKLKAAKTLVQTVDLLEGFGNEHSENVGRISSRVARELGLDDSTCRKMYLCGLLHDVGKLGLEQEIVQKAGQLTHSEFEQVKRHPELSAQIVANAGLEDIADWVRHHHEHVDGSGYPHGLVGQSIPIGSRIVLVAEAFDVMTSDRAYRRALSLVDAIGELQADAGSRFDPDVVAALVELVRRGEVQPASPQPFGVGDPGVGGGRHAA